MTRGSLLWLAAIGSCVTIGGFGCAADSGDTAWRDGDDDSAVAHSSWWPRRPRPGTGGATGDGGGATAGGGGTSGASTGGSGGASSAFGFQPIAPCLSEADYVRTGVVRLDAEGCSPHCVRLASGGTVVFMGLLAQSPVAPRPGGNSPSPIVASDAGGEVEFEFPHHGLFPFQCGRDTGVIWSTYW